MRIGKVPLLVMHHLNPLHIYCYLTKAGLNREMSLVFSRVYEKTIYKPMVITFGGLLIMSLARRFLFLGLAAVAIALLIIIVQLKMV